MIRAINPSCKTVSSFCSKKMGSVRHRIDELIKKFPHGFPTFFPHREVSKVMGIPWEDPQSSSISVEFSMK